LYLPGPAGNAALRAGLSTPAQLCLREYWHQLASWFGRPLIGIA
jgi:hypothetical protein